ncbi:cytochrome P450 89A2-like [Rutidosis leptorrhynchoides]|uniref:cytochrome P450 89A2-like n=1 Tax=Rutidosis leptorrhynchoides TaxID=125765 RepID=UPI003A996ADB
MDTWFVIVVTICLGALIRSILLLLKAPTTNQLPPGPSILHTTFLLLTNSPRNFEPVLVNLKAKYGPFFTLSVGFQSTIFIASHSLAYELLVQKGAIFSDRLKSLPILNISSAAYGPTWRLFRRNLASNIMHPSRIKSYSWARKYVLRVLIDRLNQTQESEGKQGVKVVDHFHYTMFSLSMLLCFGEKLDESQINEFAKAQQEMLSAVVSGRFIVLTMFPKLGTILFRNRWKEFEKLNNNRERILIPIINSRIDSKLSDEQTVAYIDTLTNLNLPKEEGKMENNQKLTKKDMVTMCSEFISAGSDTTVTALQWIMANLVKHPQIQKKLYDEIVSIVGLPLKGEEIKSVINEEELKKMLYLKAVVLEGLRRHPPAHLVLPHKVMKEVEVQGYVIPQGAAVNFMVGEIGLDPTVWDDPMEFKPERFLVNDGAFDISGSRGIKMMPFGAGRRVCPGLDLALLHLEYFVANLIWYFHWGVPNGYNVDFSEKTQVTVAMKNPLRTQLSARAENEMKVI